MHLLVFIKNSEKEYFAKGYFKKITAEFPAINHINGKLLPKTRYNGHERCRFL